MAVRELEGEDGEQSLDGDLALSADRAQLEALNPNQQAALVYRLEQKTLARGWAAHVGMLQRAAMDELMREEQTVQS